MSLTFGDEGVSDKSKGFAKEVDWQMRLRKLNVTDYKLEERLTWQVAVKWISDALSDPHSGRQPQRDKLQDLLKQHNRLLPQRRPSPTTKVRR